ncbi:MAG TPA: heme biosynthesis HemY N-terminal domain-containing protein [Burkholderiales bacterium]|nr:heme biosynthesis HemY N-terminal domain-containing protein [Burkholderiales bacterium]
MKLFIWMVAIFALAVALAVTIGYGNGYVLLVYSTYRVELSLKLAALLLLVGFLTAYLLIRVLVHAVRMPRRVRAYRARRRREKARSKFIEGLHMFFEGRYGTAEKAAAAALKLGESPGLTSLLAARSAHELREFDQRDAYLSEAEKQAPEGRTARLMTQADLLLDQHRDHDALAVLGALNESDSIRPLAALRLELEAQQRVKNWEQALKLIAQLEKRGFFDGKQARNLRLYATQENLKQHAKDVGELQDCWRTIPAVERKLSGIAATAARCFIALGSSGTAQEIIEQSLGEQWDSDLIYLYSECLGQNTLKQIERAETRLFDHPNDPYLLLALGRLCAHQGLWGKAQSYLEASIGVEPTVTAYRELAKLHEKIGQNDAADAHYRESLDLAVRQLRDISGGRRKLVL